MRDEKHEMMCSKYTAKVVKDAIDADDSGDVAKLRRALREAVLVIAINHEQKKRMIKQAYKPYFPEGEMPDKVFDTLKGASKKEMQDALMAAVALSTLMGAAIVRDKADSLITDIDYELPPLKEMAEVKDFAYLMENAQCGSTTH